MNRNRVMKLLVKLQQMASMSRASSPEEAAIAASRMQQLMFKYKIAHIDLELSAESTVGSDMTRVDVIGAASKLSKWKAMLADSIAKANFCQARFRQYHKGQKGFMEILGRSSDVEVVVYLYSYLMEEIMRLTDMSYEIAKDVDLLCRGSGGARKWKQSFRLGCTDMIARRLKEQRIVDEANCSSDQVSLVRQSDAAVDAYVQQMYTNVVMEKVSIKAASPAGYIAGKKAGETISLRNRSELR